MHPGFPQTEIPDKEAYNEYRDKQGARRRQDAEAIVQASIEARARESERIAHIVTPVAVSYSIKDLQASSRLMDGFKLDLSPGQVLSESQIQLVVDRAVERLKSTMTNTTTAPEVPIPPTRNRNSTPSAPQAEVAAASPPSVTRSGRDIRRVSTVREVTLPNKVRAAVMAALASLVPTASAHATHDVYDGVQHLFLEHDTTLVLGIAIIVTACIFALWARRRSARVLTKHIQSIIITSLTIITLNILPTIEHFHHSILTALLGLWFALALALRSKMSAAHAKALHS